MNTKLIHIINTVSLIINLVLYVMIIPGMIAQFFLGIIQLILAIIISTKWKKLDPAIKNLMKVYWGLVTLCTLLIGLVFADWIPNKKDAQLITFVFVTPMLTASYFVYVSWKLHNTKRIKLDKMKYQNEHIENEEIIDSTE
ncbi:hypothetical protein GCM10022393_12470 [Aquimarina addita]|uniref:Uncharacterized protein n=1 Tax=Aquimarina addita TaxID=870485 RepID=A0ABP7XEF9_9FLAO